MINDMSTNSNTDTAVITLLILKFVVLAVWRKVLIGVVSTIRDLVLDLIKSIYIYIYIQVLFYTLGVEYYSTPKCYTEQNSVLFSTRVSVLFSISWSWVYDSMILNVVQYCSVFFLFNFNLRCRIIFYT